MNRLQSELQRLYFVASAGSSPLLIDAQGRVRAMVMELTRPANWQVLSRVWRGVQVDLQLPAPAIAVSGVDGLQLWFSLEEAIPTADAHAFLDALRSHYLPEIEAMRIRSMPSADASVHAQPVPAPQASGDWSAFVAPDLAPVFAETPWLDTPPGEDNQAGLLSGLASTARQDFDAAVDRLKAFAAQLNAQPADPARADSPPAGSRPHGDPRRFLVEVMEDDTLPLELRIEAAKALLPYAAELGR